MKKNQNQKSKKFNFKILLLNIVSILLLILPMLFSVLLANKLKQMKVWAYKQ